MRIIDPEASKHPIMQIYRQRQTKQENKNRKGYIIVDALRLTISIKVHEANIHDSKKAILRLQISNISSRGLVVFLQMEVIKETYPLG